MSLGYVVDWHLGQPHSVQVLVQLALLVCLEAVRIVPGIAALDLWLLPRSAQPVPHVVGPLPACICASCLRETREIPDAGVAPATYMLGLLDCGLVPH